MNNKIVKTKTKRNELLSFYLYDFQFSLIKFIIIIWVCVVISYIKCNSIIEL